MTLPQDKVIRIKGFRETEFIITKRWLWAETTIEQIYCDKCGDGVRIVFHDKDIGKLITVLKNLNKHTFKLNGKKIVYCNKNNFNKRKTTSRRIKR
jgi:hypothetical protein